MCTPARYHFKWHSSMFAILRSNYLVFRYLHTVLGTGACWRAFHPHMLPAVNLLSLPQFPLVSQTVRLSVDFSLPLLIWQQLGSVYCCQSGRVFFLFTLKGCWEDLHLLDCPLARGLKIFGLLLPPAFVHENKSQTQFFLSRYCDKLVSWSTGQKLLATISLTNLTFFFLLI